jgi:hypothetical protein
MNIYLHRNRATIILCRKHYTYHIMKTLKPTSRRRRRRRCKLRRTSIQTSKISPLPFWKYKETRIGEKEKELIPCIKHGICLAPHTPSTEASDAPVGSANGIQGARHIYMCVCMNFCMYICIYFLP